MIAALALFLPMTAVWLAWPRRLPGRRAFAALGWRLLLRGFWVRVVVRGQPLAGPGVLFVPNHVSWMDIPVLASLLDTAFVAKGEMRGWPVLGALARAYGCLFVDRERRGEAGVQAAALADHLERRPIVLFAEGTTGLGLGVLPFRSSLFALVPGVAEGTERVQPVTLRYRRANGERLSAQQQRQVAWIDDDELLPNALGLARMGGLVAEVWFEAPVNGGDRKTLAKGCERTIAARLASD